MKEIEFLNPKFLRYFRVISETGSFLSASKNLNTSQPALTRAIKLLEFNLQKQLFLRSKKGITLTEEGKILLDYSKKNSQENIILTVESVTSEAAPGKDPRTLSIPERPTSNRQLTFRVRCLCHFAPTQLGFDAICGNGLGVMEKLLRGSPFSTAG